MTSLSPILFPNEGQGTSGRLDPNEDMDKLEALWTIAPGISTGGSRGGTSPVSEPRQEALTPEPANYHLYTSPEEILFPGAMVGGKRKVQAAITKTRLERGKFFLNRTQPST